MDLIPGLGTKIPQAMGQLSLCSETREACTQFKKAHMRQQIPSTDRKEKKKKRLVFFHIRIKRFLQTIVNTLFFLLFTGPFSSWWCSWNLLHMQFQQNLALGCDLPKLESTCTQSTTESPQLEWLLWVYRIYFSWSKSLWSCTFVQTWPSPTIPFRNMLMPSCLYPPLLLQFFLSYLSILPIFQGLSKYSMM